MVSHPGDRTADFLGIPREQFWQAAESYVHAGNGLLGELPRLTKYGPEELMDDLSEKVRNYQREHKLPVDGILNEATLWQLQVDSVADAGFGPAAVNADVWLRPGSGEYDWRKHGHSYFTLRSDCTARYDAFRSAVHSLGGLVTSSGGLRGIDAAITSGRSSASMHYVGLAFDLSISTGMSDPTIDPYLIEQDGTGWRVWARSTAAPEVTLDAVVHSGSAIESTKVRATAFDLTELARRFGFHGIGPRPGFPDIYLCAEWWHLQCDGLLTPWISQFGVEFLKLGTYSLESISAVPQIWKNSQLIFKREGGWH